MSIFVIGDLHLSQAVDKPMDIFGDNWQNHDTKIEESWKQLVSEGDTVVIPGDISWAMTAEEALSDLEFINRLPGKKILMKGNHDYWWQTAAKNRALVEEKGLTSISFLYNNSIYIEESNISICGTRGWKCPGEDGEEFSEQDEKIYLRENERLKLSVGKAKEGSKIICFLHYPPFNAGFKANLITETIEEHGIEKCFYGHLHGPSRRYSLNGKLPGGGNCEYKLVSADQLGFKPWLIKEE